MTPYRDTKSMSIGRRPLLAMAGALAMTAALFGAGPAPAAPVAQQDAEAYIQALGDRVIDLLNDASLTPDTLAEQMAGIVREGVDIKQVGVLSAGRHWNAADDAQRQAYLGLFEQYLVATYSRRLDEYSGTSFSVTGSQSVGKEDVMVVTRIAGNGPPSDVGWRLRDRGTGPKIIDVDFGGISMLKTQREEFAAVIERAGGNFSALIDALEQKVQTADAG